MSGVKFGITSSFLFLKVLNFIKTQKEKIFVICYDEFSCDYADPDIDKVYRDLLAQNKIEIINYCHPCFIEPRECEKTWRYLSLPKFIDFIKSKTLHFTRADVMRGIDKNEGLLFTKRHKEIHKEISENPEQLAKVFPDIKKTGKEILEMEEIRNSKHEQKVVNQVYINCWHLNKSENFAMWKVYSDNFGVCLQSTYGDLYQGFSDGEWEMVKECNRIFAGKVSYINTRTETIPQDYSSRPFMYKIEEFAYENELRFVIYDPNEKSQFKKIQVNPEKLINRIYISPFAPDWFEDVIRDLCKKYGVSSEIIKSEMN